MPEFFSKPYFDDLVQALNASDEFKQKTANVATTILMVEKERSRAFLLAVDKGAARVAEAAPDAKADFTFIGDAQTWWANHKGEAPMEKLVMTGKLKFKGSIPKIMSMRAQLGVIDRLAQGVPAEPPQPATA